MLCIAMVLPVGAVAGWHYVVKMPVETGAVLVCADCGVLVESEVHALRVVFWQRHLYSVERRQGLCQRCAEVPVKASVERVTYCGTCGKTIRTETVSATVPKGAYTQWVDGHRWQRAECGWCESQRLVRRGLKAQEQGRYAEAESCFASAGAASPQNADAGRFLRALRDLHREEIARQKMAHGDAHRAQVIPSQGRWVGNRYVDRFVGDTDRDFEARCTATESDPNVFGPPYHIIEEAPGQGRWVGNGYVERFVGESDADFEQRCHDSAVLQAIAGALRDR